MEDTGRKVSATSRRISKGIENSRVVEVDTQKLEAFMFREEPSRITDEDFREFLMSCVMSGASDVTVQSDQQPRAEIHGVLYRATRKPWSPSEVDQVLMEVYGGANARTEINGQRILDFSYEMNLVDGSRQRFRVNATGIYGRDGNGVEITMRALPSKTPDLKMVQLDGSEGTMVRDESAIVLDKAEEEVSGLAAPFISGILDAMKPKNGIVVVAGGTGSGKSTTLAAVTNSHLQDPDKPVKIVDIQAPIEYTFRDITSGMSGSSSLIGQSEVGRHIKSFADGVHSALRRKPNVIIVGEARDYETISASLEASLTGHLVYTTTHANDVSDTIRRLLSTFPANERDARAFDLISALRFCMVQYLLPRIDKPGRVPVREFIKFTPRLKEKLVRLPINDWPGVLVDEVRGVAEGTGEEDMRQSLFDVVKPLYSNGIIAREDAFLLGGLAAVEDQEVLS
jgi:defect-in-organelle-trafficking protein DotB